MLHFKKFRAALLLSLPLILFSSTFSPFSANASLDRILGTAGNYQLLSGASLTLGASITGLDPQYSGKSTQAVADLRSALTTYSGVDATPVAADLGGKTYLPGSYVALGGAAFTMTSNIVIDGANDCNSIFFFITPAAMNTTAGITITLINGASANNIYWLSGAAITIGASDNISGNFLSAAAITVGASTSVNGRLLGIAAVSVGASSDFQTYPMAPCSEVTGALSISVPESLNVSDIYPGDTVNVELGRVQVSDTRISGAPWQSDVQISNVSSSSGDQISGKYFSYAFLNLTSIGGISLTEHPINEMTGSSLILESTSRGGVNGAAWTPIITIAIPLNQPAGAYTGVVTHSVY